jgi:hypothetical protein
MNFNLRNEPMKKDDLMEISNNSFKIPRSPIYNNPNQMRQFREQEKEIMNNEGRYDNYNPNERFMNNKNDEQINFYQKRKNNDFNNYNMNNQYPRIMDNDNNLRNKNIDCFREYNNDNETRNKRYNDYDEPRVLFNNKNDTLKKDNFVEISNNSFKIPRSPIYNNPNQMRQYREQEKEVMNNEGRYKNYNPNERFMKNENDEQINFYEKRNNNDFNNYNMNNQYPRIMDNENNLRNRNIERFREYNNDNEFRNKRYNDYEEPRVLYNNNFRSQEIPRRNNIPRSPMYYEDNEGNMMNNRYNNSIRERMNDIDLNDMRIKNEERKFNSGNQRYGVNNNTRRGYYNSQLNFPPKEEAEY